MIPLRYFQFVLKISKLCNLRCSYCYEYPELGKKARMPLDKLRRFFESVNADLKTEQPCNDVEFVWHGGEPLLIETEYYAAIGALQKNALSIPFANVVQTNLTVMSDKYWQFLKDKTFFHDLGVSFDVYGDQRVDIRGKLRTDTVLKNLQRLIEDRIDFGAVCVLAKNTLPHVRAIHRFYDSLGIEYRLLPFYRSTDGDQAEEHSLTFEEIVTALNAVFDEWLVSENATPVEPLDQYINYAVEYLRGTKPRHYDKEKEESVFLINPDGAIWGTSEAYDPNYRYGNVFEEDVSAILASPARRRSIEDARTRMEVHCRGCPYFGACPGGFVGDATPIQENMIRQSGCTVRGVISHVVARLQETGLTQTIMDGADRQVAENRALSITL
jgi:uncharacterized protein